MSHNGHYILVDFKNDSSQFRTVAVTVRARVIPHYDIESRMRQQSHTCPAIGVVAGTARRRGLPSGTVSGVRKPLNRREFVGISYVGSILVGRQAGIFAHYSAVVSISVD
jgi:hypothetical protein